MGHAPVRDMVRILRHGGGSEEAIKTARDFHCEVCDEAKRPTLPEAVSNSRVTEFNEQVGFDILEIPGWKGKNHRVPAVNLVDDSSSYQLVIHLPREESAVEFRRAYQ